MMNRNELDFVTYCVGSLANSLNLTRQDVYGRLKSSGILEDYIVKHYDVLHTFSRPSIVDELTEYMREKGVLE